MKIHYGAHGTPFITFQKEDIEARNGEKTWAGFLNFLNVIGIPEYVNLMKDWSLLEVRKNRFELAMPEAIATSLIKNKEALHAFEALLGGYFSRPDITIVPVIKDA